MASPRSSDVYVDPDLAALRITQTQRETSTTGRQAGSKRPKRKHLRVHFEDTPFELRAHYPATEQRAASMSSTTASVYIDPIGLYGPPARPVLNTTTEPRQPSLQTHRSRSSTARSVHADQVNSEPWNWPKLLASSQNHKVAVATMNPIKDNIHTRPLTKRQLSAIRKIVCRPAMHSAGGRNKPIQPPSRRSIVLDIPALHSNAPSEASDDQTARSAWNYPKLEARPSLNAGRKRENRAQKPESAIDLMPDLFNIHEDLPSQCFESEPVIEPALMAQKQQKGKQKGKQTDKQNSKQDTRQSRSKVDCDDLPKSHLYGGYGEGTSTERAQLPTELHAQSPTPSSKFKGWNMEPRSSPPLGPVDRPRSLAGSGGDWGAPDLFEEAAPKQTTERSRRSKHSHHTLQKAPPLKADSGDDWGAPDLFLQTSLKQLAEGSRHSKHSQNEFQRAPTIAAGSVVWGDPTGITGAGAEAWADNTAESAKTSHEGSVQPSSKTGSRQSNSRTSNALGDKLHLETILEDALLESSQQRREGLLSRHGKVVKSYGRRSRFGEAIDNRDVNDKLGSQHGSGSKRIEGRQLRPSEAVDDWSKSKKPASRHGCRSKSEGQRSRHNAEVDEWQTEGEVVSRHGPKSDSRPSRCSNGEAGSGWDVNEQDRSGTAGGSQVGWNKTAPSDRWNQAGEEWDKSKSSASPKQQHPASKSLGSTSHKALLPSQSNHRNEFEDGRQSNRQSHRSGSGSHKTSSRKFASPSLSPSKKGTIAGSYVTPTVEEDPSNWVGWIRDSEKSSSRRSKSHSHKTQSEAVVEEWLGSVEGPRSTATATSSTTSNSYALSAKGDALDAWGLGKVPSEGSIGTGYGRHHSSTAESRTAGSALSGGENWSRSGRIEGETGRRSWADESRRSSISAQEQAPARASWDTSTSSSREAASIAPSKHRSSSSNTRTKHRSKKWETSKHNTVEEDGWGDAAQGNEGEWGGVTGAAQDGGGWGGWTTDSKKAGEEGPQSFF